MLKPYERNQVRTIIIYKLYILATIYAIQKWFDINKENTYEYCSTYQDPSIQVDKQFLLEHRSCNAQIYHLLDYTIYDTQCHNNVLGRQHDIEMTAMNVRFDVDRCSSLIQRLTIVVSSYE